MKKVKFLCSKRFDCKYGKECDPVGYVTFWDRFSSIFGTVYPKVENCKKGFKRVPARLDSILMEVK